MHFILSIFQNRPGKIVLYGYIYPGLAVLASMALYFVSGCSGGFIDSPLECSFPLYKILWFPHFLHFAGSLYLVAVGIPFFAILCVAIMRAIRVRVSSGAR